MSNSDLEILQKEIQAIKRGQENLSSQELSAFNSLNENLCNGNFKSIENEKNIKILKNAVFQPKKLRIFQKIHLLRFIALCKKYFNTSTESTGDSTGIRGKNRVQSPPLSEPKPDKKDKNKNLIISTVVFAFKAFITVTVVLVLLIVGLYLYQKRETKTNIIAESNKQIDSVNNPKIKSLDSTKFKKIEIISDVKTVDTIKKEKLKSDSIELQREEKLHIPPSKKDTIYEHVDVMPEFLGGDAELAKWLSSNIHYPTIASEQGIQGRVVLKFVVRPDGSIDDVQVVRPLEPSCDKEAIQAVKQMPKWIPGKQGGNPVSVYFNLPIAFKLIENNKPQYVVNRRFSNGYYTGYMLNWKRQGKGIYKYDSGDTYEGDYENDQMSGNGKIISISKKFTYEGHFANGMFDGQGTYKNERDGWEHVGLFKNGKPHGKGIRYYNKGKPTNGIWENGVLVMEND